MCFIRTLTVSLLVSRTLTSANTTLGPNAKLVEDDLEEAIRGLKAEHVGEIDVAGPDLAGSLTNLGLIDEYRLYLHPVVIGSGKPFFTGPRPPLRLVTSDRVGEDVIEEAKSFDQRPYDNSTKPFL
jgi:riboflavin biosynthesis pyrimidine reductase